jgi:ubiquinone/menaquinone biosynthesis C-methylase UbiE
MEYTLLMQNKTLSATFKDLFSDASENYQTHRPRYPEKLFQYLSEISPTTENVWDCATGSGQAAHSLNQYFSQVFATDASQNQIASATSEDGIEFSIATAENSGLQSNSIDLICVAQALHWFDFDAFFLEVNRVLKADGILAVWSYELLSITAEIDQIVNEFYLGVLDGYWSDERIHIENNYLQLNFPYPKMPTQSFKMICDWNLFDLMGYFSTWSAVKKYKNNNADDPLVVLQTKLLPLWGVPQQQRMIRWPLNLILCRKPNNNK